MKVWTRKMSKNLSAAYKTNKRYIITFFAVFFSALLQTFVLQTFLNPSDLLSSGFTGVAILINRISMLYGYSLSISTLVIVLNLPVAIVCYKTIGKKFVFFSFLQVIFFSIFTRVLSFNPLFDDVILNVCFGGFLYGFAIACDFPVDLFRSLICSAQIGYFPFDYFRSWI